MRERRVLSGWRLWITVGLLSLVLLLAVFSLMKILSSPSSPWDISWTELAWLSAGTTLVVCLWTYLSVRMKSRRQ
jgi:Na+/melibiose symporter-like transporter